MCVTAAAAAAVGEKEKEKEEWRTEQGENLSISALLANDRRPTQTRTQSPPFFLLSFSLCPTITHYSSRNARPRTKRTLIHAAASPFMTITDKLPPPPFLSFFVCIRRVASFRRSHPQWIHFQVFI